MELVKRFAEYYKPHKKLFALDITSAFLLAVIDLIFPLYSRHILNDIIPNQNVRALVNAALILLGMFILRGILNYIVHYWGHVVGVRIEADMRNDIFSHMQTMDTSFFDNNKTGKLMSRIVNDLREISELAHHGPEDLFLSMIMLVGSFVILLTVEWRLALLIFVFVPFIAWFAIKRRKKMRNAFREVRKKIANVNSQLENSISGIRESKTYTNEEMEYDKFLEGNTEFQVSREYAFKRMAEFFTGIEFLLKILNLVVIVAGGYFIFLEYMDYPDLIAFLLYINIFMQPIRRLTNFTQQFELGMSGFERFAEIMDTNPSITNSENAMRFNELNNEIKFENVGFSYDEDECILKDINFSIQKGNTLALVGPSGGGKTTICNLLPRFYDINSGKITIDGTDIKAMDIRSLRSNIGFVQQDVFLFGGTIRENILYGNPNATDEEIKTAAKNANIHNFIENLPNGYDTQVGERGIKLSGGQKQRVSIARVFLKNPPILILDEATSALDNETEIKIQKSLRKLSKGRTTIVIAHRLSTIRNADEIIVLTDQGIVERGTHKALLEKEKLYSKLYKAQFHGFMPDELE